MVHVRQLLQGSTVFAADGIQMRPLERSDVLEVLARLEDFALNALDPGVIMFDGLDLKDADLRGLNLAGGSGGWVSFCGCDMRGVIASPLVTSRGQELEIGDLAYGFLVNLWSGGETEKLAEFSANVERTRLDGAWFMDANLDRAVFSHARLTNAVMQGVEAERVEFNWCDLRDADLRWATFTNTDFAGSKLQRAELYGTDLRNCFLDGIDWGHKQAIVQEDRDDWDAAWAVYRRLTAIHDTAGLLHVAAEFRYRRERARTKALFNDATGLPIPVRPIKDQPFTCNHHERTQADIRKLAVAQVHGLVIWIWRTSVARHQNDCFDGDCVHPILFCTYRLECVSTRFRGILRQHW